MQDHLKMYRRLDQVLSTEYEGEGNPVGTATNPLFDKFVNVHLFTNMIQTGNQHRTICRIAHRGSSQFTEALSLIAACLS